MLHIRNWNVYFRQRYPTGAAIIAEGHSENMHWLVLKLEQCVLGASILGEYLANNMYPRSVDDALFSYP